MKNTVYAFGLDQLTVNAIKEKEINIMIVSVLPKVEEIEPGSILMLNGEDISLESVFELKKTYSNVTLAYLDTNKDMRKSVMQASKCSMQAVEYFSSKATIETYVNRLKQLLEMDINDTSRIIGFFGSGTGVGSTSVSKQFAKRIAAAGKSVIHLGLDLFDPGWDSKVTVSLDIWRSKLTAKIIQNDDFKELIKLGDVTYLPGNFDYLASFDYKVEEIGYLLDKAQEEFDVVVADFGSICDSAAWYIGMQKTAIRIMVTHPEHEYRLASIKEVVTHMQLDFDSFLGVFNKQNSNSGITAQDIKKAVGLSIILEFPTYQLESDRVLPIGKKEQTNIDDQVRHFLAGLGFEINQTKRWGGMR